MRTNGNSRDPRHSCVTLEQMEKVAVIEALSRQGGIRTQAARSLGISVRTLQRKLKKWRLQDRPPVVNRHAVPG